MLILLLLLIPFSVHLWGFSVDIIARLHPKKQDSPIKDGRDFSFTVLVPAHNEQDCISGVLESLGRQTYRNFEIYVIDDCSTDGTKKTASGFSNAGIITKSTKSVSKGDALNYALDTLGEKLGDAVVVLDADCTVNPEFLEKLNEKYKSGSKAVMPDTDISNPYKSIVTAWYTIYWKMVSEMSRSAHAKLKLSGNLCGCGMSFRKEYLHKTVTITEDVEYFMILGSEGVRIDYAGKSTVYQEQPFTIKDMFGQLYRWMSGVRSVNKIYLMLYLRSLIKKFSFLKLDSFMTAQACSAYGIITATVIASLIAGHLFAPGILPGVRAFTVFSLFIMLGIGLTVTKRCKLKNKIMIAAIPTYCLFLMAMGLVYIYAAILPGKAWTKVDRSKRDEPKN